MQRLKIGVLAGLTLLTALVWYAVWQEEQRGLTVAFLDVGQGDSSLIMLPGGVKMLIDGGQPNGRLEKNLEKILLSHF